MKRFFQSLQAKYMTIILVALFLFQAAYLLIAMLAMGLQEDISGEKSKNESDPNHIEEKWHADAKKLERASQEAILSHFSKWKKKYPDASMFWVDEHGNLMEQLDVKGDLPFGQYGIKSSYWRKSGNIYY